MRHHDMLLELKGEHLAMLEMRSHTGWYLKGMPNASAVRNQICQLKDFNEVTKILKDYLLEEE